MSSLSRPWRRARRSCSGAAAASLARGARHAGFAVVVAVAGAGCAQPPAPAAPAPAGPQPAPRAAAVAEAPPPAREPSQRGPVPDACGPFECFWADGGSEALSVVLAEEPLALGLGEAHALAGTEHVTSTARRFTSELLPELRERASHLVVELLNPDPRCAAATREVRRAQEPVTAPQASSNQDDYVELGRRARGLGIEPFVLSPTCDEYRAIAAAGDEAVERMLETIARVTSRMLRAAIVKNRDAGRPALVIGYGGALHNDIAPSDAKAAWSYGPDLSAFTAGRYVELDLIVREFIKDTEVWRALPWYAHFDPGRDIERWLVMRTGSQRYVLFFPKTPASAAP